MHQLLELIPIALFFIVFSMKGETISLFGWQHELDGIYSATAVLMIATVLQVIISFVLTRKLEKRQLMVAAIVLIAGTLTLVFHNKLFIQWKPTIVNGVFALVFLIAPYFGEKKTLIERAIGAQLPNIPHKVWLRLNTIWVIIFATAGLLNIIVAYNFTEAQWVSYKLYSAIAFIAVQSILTALVLSPYMKEQPTQEP